MTKQLLYEINTRYWLYQLRNAYDAGMTLATIPDGELERIAADFDWVWLMGIWDHSDLDAEFLQDHPGLIHEVEEALEDWSDGDIIGSPYSIKTYSINPMLGDLEGFLLLRKKFNELGVKVMVDFVPNHYGFHTDVALRNPDYFINIDHEPPKGKSHLFRKVETEVGTRWIAYGKDPYFPPWYDTYQVNFWNPDTRDFMIAELETIAAMSDGVRCDMAMLVNNDVVDMSWGWLLKESWDRPEDEFWPIAIEEIKEKYPDFIFMAEVYWDMEWDLLKQGFDFAYDKRLYDRFVSKNIFELHEHLQADITYQAHMCRFIENHDENRALAAMTMDQSLAAAAMIMTLPGISLIHHGQMTGQKKKIPVQLLRKSKEVTRATLQQLYKKIIRFTRNQIPREAIWQYNDVIAASELPSGSLFSWSWQTNDKVSIIVINYTDVKADGLVQLNTGHSIFENKHLFFTDLYNDTQYMWHSEHIKKDGLYVKLPKYGIHLFIVEDAD